MKNIKKAFLAISLFSLLSLVSIQSEAHCEIPCGIYADSVRITLIYEHITTVEKSMKLINELSQAENPDYNQLVRWVTNKEEHAKKIQEIVAQYFLHQRIKPVAENAGSAYDKYINQLVALHKIQVLAMKTKQSTNLELIEELHLSVKAFEDLYFHKH